MATFLDLIVTGPTCAIGSITAPGTPSTPTTIGLVGNIDWTKIINKVYASSTADGIMTKADFTTIQNWKNNDLVKYASWIDATAPSSPIDWTSEANKYNHWP